jgi:hypothetical protein
VRRRWAWQYRGSAATTWIIACGPGDVRAVVTTAALELGAKG